MEGQKTLAQLEEVAESLRRAPGEGGSRTREAGNSKCTTPMHNKNQNNKHNKNIYEYKPGRDISADFPVGYIFKTEVMMNCYFTGKMMFLIALEGCA
jgi:hypothetical protein